MSEQCNTDTSLVVDEVWPVTHYSREAIEHATRVLYRLGKTVQATKNAILECAKADAMANTGTRALDSFIHQIWKDSVGSEAPSRQYTKPKTARESKKADPKLNRKQRRDAQFKRGAWA